MRTKFTLTAVSSSLLLLSSMTWGETEHSMVHQHEHATMSMLTESMAMPTMDTGMEHSQMQHQSMVMSSSVIEAADHSSHAKEHGGQIYQSTTLESRWLRNEEIGRAHV